MTRAIETHLSGGLAVAFALAVPVWSAPVQDLPAAREIIDRHLTATNARAVIEKTSCRHMKGEISFPAARGEIEIWSAKPDKYVVIMKAGGMVHPYGFNDGVAWERHPMLGPDIKKGADHLQLMLTAAYDAALKPDSLYESLKTVGRESFEDRDCYKVKVVAKPLKGMDAEETIKSRTSFEFYEVESGLLAGRTSYEASTDDGEVKFSAYLKSTRVFSDYRKFGEGLVATRTVLRFANNEFGITLLSVEYPKEVDSTVFALPESIQAKLDEQPASGDEEG